MGVVSSVSMLCRSVQKELKAVEHLLGQVPSYELAQVPVNIL